MQNGSLLLSTKLLWHGAGVHPWNPYNVSGAMLAWVQRVLPSVRRIMLGAFLHLHFLLYKKRNYLD